MQRNTKMVGLSTLNPRQHCGRVRYTGEIMGRVGRGGGGMGRRSGGAFTAAEHAPSRGGRREGECRQRQQQMQHCRRVRYTGKIMGKGAAGVEGEWAAEAEAPAQEPNTHLREGEGARVCAGRGSSSTRAALRRGKAHMGCNSVGGTAAEDAQVGRKGAAARVEQEV